MLNINKYFENRKVDIDKLINYGFKKENDIYKYQKNILDNHFSIIVLIGKDKYLKVDDLDSEEEYLPSYIKNSKGSFVGSIKEEYELLIKDIINNCTNLDIYKNKNTIKLINYIKDNYKGDLEFLWDKYPSFSVVRNENNNKWYVLIAKLKENVLGPFSDKEIEVMNVRYQKDKVKEVIDNKNIFPAYHMNKRSWITVRLDSLSFEKIKELLDNSYNLITGKTGLKVSDMEKKVYEYLLKIPKGKVVTYKQIAMYLGNPGLARIVGSILRKGTDLTLPYYKVLNSKGEIIKSSYSSYQKKLLEAEGIKVENNKVDLNIYKWEE